MSAIDASFTSPFVFSVLQVDINVLKSASLSSETQVDC